MNWLDWVLLALVAACMLLAWRVWRKAGRRGGCGCGCDRCSRSCCTQPGHDPRSECSEQKSQPKTGSLADTDS